jgi:hypothetical protein
MWEISIVWPAIFFPTTIRFSSNKKQKHLQCQIKFFVYSLNLIYSFIYFFWIIYLPMEWIKRNKVKPFVFKQITRYTTWKQLILIAQFLLFLSYTLIINRISNINTSSKQITRLYDSMYSYEGCIKWITSCFICFFPIYFSIFFCFCFGSMYLYNV